MDHGAVVGMDQGAVVGRERGAVVPQGQPTTSRIYWRQNKAWQGQACARNEHPQDDIFVRLMSRRNVVIGTYFLLSARMHQRIKNIISTVIRVCGDVIRRDPDRVLALRIAAVHGTVIPDHGRDRGKDFPVGG